MGTHNLVKEVKGAKCNGEMNTVDATLDFYII